MMNRRQLLGTAGAAGVAGMLGGLSLPGIGADEDYRALVVVYLNGGNDGHNTLVPTDAAYNDYQTARANLAMSKSSLANLPGTAIGHSFGLHSALSELVPLYTEGRLGFVANVGPLVEPSTAQSVLAGSVKVPPFLMSHSDQTAMVQGWMVSDDTSGWAGRGLERLPSNLRNALSAVTMDNNRTLVLGQQSSVSFMPPGGSRWWGTADLAQPESASAQSLNRMARWQFANAYEAEYARTFGSAISDSTLSTKAFMAAIEPTADFGSNTDHGDLPRNLRSLASVLPVFKAQGLKRQVFLKQWGGFDTHTNQRGTGSTTQDGQLAILAKALTAFDATNRANGLDMNVITLVMSEFGRTLRPGSGGGSEHAWGNHWFALGGPVAGGTVYGSFPSLVLGGIDDGDRNKNGRFVPGISSDQVGATLMQWIGLPSSQLVDVFPNLVNFPTKTIALLRV
jgi:uncharacterized protein (DUF1501 family)